MKRILIIIALSLIFKNTLIAQYISPGIRIGYDFDSHITMGLKISLGINYNETITNVTFGKKFALNNTDDFMAHYYFDMQYGKFSETFSERKIKILYGGGIGLIFYTKNGRQHFHPRITSFVGYLLFTTFDINIIKWKSVKPDLGLQLVLPIPLGNVDFGSPGG